MTINRICSNKRFSQAVVYSNTIYLTGQVALDTKGASAAVQTKEILDRIDDLLKEGGTDKSRILFSTIYLADLNDYNEMNKIWDAWIVPGTAPARACVGANLVHPDFLVEICVVAAV